MLRVAEHFSDSDVGRQRQGNEDSYFVRSPLFVVADGMGGAQAGEVASDMAVRSFDAAVPDRDPGRALAEVVRAANRRIHERSRSDRQRAGMGTTLTAAYVTASGEVVVAHVGDSRCYLLRDGDLVRLTRDHSLVGELVARGKLTEEQAERHPQRSVITRALGPEPEVEVDVDAFSARAGDVFLVCSDGLTSMLTESEVKAIAGRPGPLERRGRELIAAANRAGGRDNITVVLFRLEDAHADAAAAGGPRTAARQADEGSGETVQAPAVSARDTASGGADGLEEPSLSHAGATSETAALQALAPPDADHGRHRRTWLRVLGVVVLIILPVVIALWIASRVVYFIGTDPERNRVITIYRGVPYELPGGIPLYERFYPSGVTLQSVPESRRAIFTDHQLRSRDDAEDLIIALERGELNR
jgi:serine/threonine protein phosphatase PrpC